MELFWDVSERSRNKTLPNVLVFFFYYFLSLFFGLHSKGSLDAKMFENLIKPDAAEVTHDKRQSVYLLMF